MPHVAEDLYQNLVRSTGVEAPESAHLCDFPTVDPKALDAELLNTMESARKLVSLGRAAREQAQIKVRQPLAVMHVAVPDGQWGALEGEFRDVILEELNVKKLERAPEEAEFVEYRIRPNLPLLGKRYGREVQSVRAALSAVSPAEVAAAVRSEKDLTVHLEDREWVLSPEEILVDAVRREGFTAAASEGYLVALDTTITPALRHEGLARELARSINDLRKEEGLALEDRITIQYAEPSEGFRQALAEFMEYVKRETLATEIVVVDVIAEDTGSKLETDGEAIRLAVRKA